MSNEKTNTNNKMKKSIFAISVALICLLTIVIGAVSVGAVSKSSQDLLFSCNFDNSFNNLSTGKNGENKNTEFYNNALHINNGHKAGNSKFDATSYVKYDGIKEIGESDFTIAFDYFANQPTAVKSTILSTGKEGEGLNIFNKSGLGISIGGLVMQTNYLTENQLKMGSVRLDSNLLNDGKWHSVLLTVARAEDANLYVDGFFRERMTLKKLKGQKIASDMFVIGADTNLKYGSEDMYIKNLAIYGKICDKSGHALFDEYQWLVASKKAQQVLVDYVGLADESTLTALKNIAESEKPTDKSQVESAVKKVDNAIKKVVDSAKKKRTNNFQILSDTHMMTSSLSSKESLMDSLNNIASWFSDTSALVVTGDLTDNGYDVQYDKYYDALRKCNKAPYTMNLTGNHESSYNDTSMEEDNKRFLGYNNAYTKEVYGWTVDKVYYDKWINGYHFIGLGSEETLRDGGHGYYSPEQIKFLKDKLAESDENGNYDPSKPVFVFNHQPLTNTTPNSDVFGVGPQSGELTEIFRNYPQVVYVSGHVHNGYVGGEAMYNDGYGMLVDTPCLRANDAVRYRKSIGYNVSIYTNKVIFTPVNFTDDDIMYDMTIVIDDGTRETKTPNYDIKDVEIKVGSRNLGNRLTDSANSSYCVFAKGDEIVYNFNEECEIDGLRIGTTYWNIPSKIFVSTSSDGKTFGDYKEYSLDVSKNIQKVFLNKQTVKSIKIKFEAKTNIVLLVPTLKK